MGEGSCWTPSSNSYINMKEDWNRVKITKVKVLGIGPFLSEYSFYLEKDRTLVTGDNGSGKTILLKCIEFFFNENKYLKSLTQKEMKLEKPFIELAFSLDDEEVEVKKIIGWSSSSIRVSKTEYSRSNYPTAIINYIEKAFVYYFSAERLLSEKDDEFAFIKNSILSRLEEQSIDIYKSLNIDLGDWLEEYYERNFHELKEDLRIFNKVSFKSSIKLDMDWINKPFIEAGSSKKKELALKALYSYINARIKGPNVFLIDSIETYFDRRTIITQLARLISLNTSLQIISTLSWTVVNSLDEYNLVVIDGKAISSRKVSGTQVEDILV